MLAGSIKKYDETPTHQTCSGGSYVGSHSPEAKKKVEDALAQAEKEGFVEGAQVRIKSQNTVGTLHLEKLVHIAFNGMTRPADIFRVHWKTDQGYTANRLTNINEIELVKENENGSN